MGMFDNWTEEEMAKIPDNRIVRLPCTKRQKVVVGADSVNTFEMPFKDGTEYSAKVIYTQEARLSFEVTPAKDDCEVDAKRGVLRIKVSLTPEQTAQLGGTLIDTRAQVRVIYDGLIAYSKIYRIDVLPTLG